VNSFGLFHIEKSRRTALVTLVLAAAAAVVVALLARPGEPSYHGHTLSSWVKVIAPNNTQTFGPDCTAREAPDAIRPQQGVGKGSVITFDTNEGSARGRS